MLKDTYYTDPTEVDQLVFAKLVPPDHYLRRVKQVLDFERLRTLVTDCYSPAMGRTAEDPVRLIKLEFLQFHSTRSDREVIATAQVNVAFRFFLDMSLEVACRGRAGWRNFGPAWAVSAISCSLTRW